MSGAEPGRGLPTRFASALIWLPLLALAALAAYGRGYVGYDGFFALAWGSELMHGGVPDFESPVAPTPHPLSLLVGALLSPLDSGAPTAYQALVLLSFGALGWAAFELGRRLFSTPVGAVFALLMLTRPALAREMLHASIDIPFLALVMSAAAVEAGRPRRGVLVLLLLAAAGLLRPEAWLLSAAYLAYLFPDAAPRERVRLSALAAAAPVLWALTDLLLTGDPLHSLHGTRELAEQLDRPRSAGTAPQLLPRYLLYILEEPVTWCGVAGCLAVLWLFYQRALLPLAILFLGLLGFLVLGVAGLPLLTRYLLLPALMLALFCAVALVGWLQLEAGTRVRRAWMAAAAVVGAVLVITAPGDVDELREAKELGLFRRDVQRDAEAIARRIDDAPCGPIHVPNHRPVPLLAYWLDAPSGSILQREERQPTEGVFLAPATDAVVRSFLASPGDTAAVDVFPPPGFERNAENSSWVVFERC
jgi:hypothetical protein